MSRATILSLTLIAGLCFANSRADDAPGGAGGLSTRASIGTAERAINATQWLQWRGPDRAGKSPDTGLLKDWSAQKPKLLWTAEGLGEGYASVSSADDRIYTTGNQPDGQAVVCISAGDGRVIWKKNFTSDVPKHGHDGSRCTPSIDGSRLFAIASSGKIACLMAEDGREIWSRDFVKEWGGRMPNWGFSESPLVDGDWVLCTPGGPDAMIVALDKLTGKEVWRSKVPNLGRAGREEAGYSSIVISNACGVKQYVQLVGSGLIGVRATDGQFLWGYNAIANRTANIPTPIVDGDSIFCSTGYNTGAALVKLTKSGDEIRCDEQYFVSGDKLQNHHGQMILKDGYVYFGNKHRNGFPVCVEMESGKIAWGGDQRGAGSGSAAITYADGHLVFRYESGEVALIEATPSAYRLKGAFRPDYISRKPCWAHPVITGGRMYLRDQDKLMCYDVRQ
jgi:outer membrane protein assembly factor BamB